MAHQVIARDEPAATGFLIFLRGSALFDDLTESRQGYAGLRS
jgi:hypothetical protein